MYSLHITEQALTDICAKKYNNWHKIATKQTSIVVNCNDDSLIYSDPENIIYLFGLMYNVKFESNMNYINNIEANPNTILENPCGAFILDIENEVAKKIESDFGVICQSSLNINDMVLTDTIEKSPKKDETNIGWEDLLTHFKSHPSNALIISDRNIFANDDGLNKKGIDNIYKIADAILPDTFATTYHIAIAFDSPKAGITFSQIATWINKSLRGIRAYQIVIEVISIKRHCKNYDKTHNRRIITNYGIARAEHMISGFDDKRCICTQTINCDLLYSKGLSGKSDLPKKSHEDFISVFSEIVNYGKSNPNSGYEYACNGNCKVTFKDFQNRLLQ